MILDFSKQLFSDLTDMLTASEPHRQISQSQFNSLVESALRKCQLVTREEFETQQAVLLKTREKLELLENELHQLEGKINHKN